MLHVYNRIETKPEVMLGKPVVKGTRIPVELIVRKLGEGASVEDLLDAYPNLPRERCLKGLPVFQCDGCSEYLLEDRVLKRVEEILEKVDTGAELEVIKYAA